VVLPSKIKPMPGNQAEYGTRKHKSGLSAVLLLPCGPLALIPVNEKKRNRTQNSDRKITAAHASGVAEQ
jgi:hypothetical protein